MKFAAALIACGVLSLSSSVGAQRIGQLQRIQARRQARQLQRQQQLAPLLQLVINASHTLQFKGTRTVTQKVKGKPVSHVEYVERIGETVRIDFPNDSPYRGQVIIDSGSERRHLFPGRKVMTIEPGHRDDVLSRLINAENKFLNPRVSFANGGNIAGINTTVANIMDRNNAVVQQLYIDPRTGAVLKRVGYDRFGQQVAFLEYTSINYNAPVAMTDFNVSSAGIRLVTPQDQLKNVALKAGLPNYSLAKNTGYSLLNARMLDKGNTKVLQQVYQGKNGRVSVFELRANVDPSVLKKSAGARANAYTFAADGVTFVFVGPVDQAELRTLASGFSNH